MIGGTPPADSGLENQTPISKLNNCDSVSPLTLEKSNVVTDNEKGQFIFSGEYNFTKTHTKKFRRIMYCC